MRIIFFALILVSNLLTGCTKCSRQEPLPPPIPPAEQAIPDDQGGDGETLPPGDDMGQDLPPDEEMPDQPVEDD